MKTAVLDSQAPPRSSASPKAARFIRLWNAPVLSSPWARALLIGAMAALCLARAYVGMWGYRTYTHDAFSALDGAWRVLNGQVPHVNFYTALGPLSYIVTALGLLLAKGGSAGLAYGQAIFGAVTGFWSYSLARTRLGNVAVALVSLTTVLIAVAPTSVGEPFRSATPGMIYNRFGYALLIVFLVEAVIEPPVERTFWGGFSSGVAAALLLFLKISFLLAAGFLAVLLLPMRTQTRDRWRGVAVGAAVAALPLLLYLRFDVMAVFGDLWIAAHTKHVQYGGYLLYDIVICAFPFLLCVFSLAFSVKEGRERWAMILGALAVCLAGFFLLLTSWQFLSLPLNGVMAVLLLDRTIRRSAAKTAFWTPRYSVLLLLALMTLSNVSTDAMAVGFTVSQKLNAQSADLASFSPPALAGFTTAQHDYAAFVNDGVSLLNRYRRPGDSVLSLDFTNPFSYSLGMKPAWGGTPWLQYGNNFDETHGPAAERLFGDVQLVMVPKEFTDPTLISSIPRIYGPYLAAHFHLAGESASWRLYRRVN